MFAILRRDTNSCLSCNKVQCYKNLVTPVQKYSASMRDPSSKKNIHTIEKVQKMQPDSQCETTEQVEC